MTSWQGGWTRRGSILGAPSPARESRIGVICALAAYGLWGLMPLYFTALRTVPAGEILAQRIVWCGLLLMIVLSIGQRWKDLIRAWSSRRHMLIFCSTASLLSINWLIYIYGVTSKQTLETSLGYFINPLFSVGLGMLVFQERLRPWQYAALGLAALGVLNLSIIAGQFPWIAVSLACSFSLYGMLRKLAATDALIGLSIETFLLVGPAMGYLIWLMTTDKIHLGTEDRLTDFLLIASGVITAVPLICFGAAARRLRLSTLGFLQYIGPTAQFLIAVWVLREPMRPVQWASFACIWIALLLYSIDTWRGSRAARIQAASEAKLNQTG